GGAAFRLHQRIVAPRFCWVDVKVSWRHIEVTCKHDRRSGFAQRGRSSPQPLKPLKLVVEFGTWLRIAVRRIDACNQHTLNRGLEITRLKILLVTRQLATGDEGLTDPRKNGNAVPG